MMAGVGDGTWGFGSCTLPLEQIKVRVRVSARDGARAMHEVSSTGRRGRPNA